MQAPSRIVAGGLLVLATMMFSSTASARTWRVLRDGTGDFTTLQPAGDAAAAGDTIWVGPGRYREKELRQIDCCQSLEVYLLVSQPNITLIGSHRDSVIIGPDNPTGNQICIVPYPGQAPGFNLRSVTLQNTECGLRMLGQTTCQDVHFFRNGEGIFAVFGGTGTIDACLFTECVGVGVFGGNGSSNLLIRSCSFIDCDEALNFTASIDPIIEDCWIEGGIAAITASGFGVRLRLERTILQDIRNVALYIANNAEIRAFDNLVSPGRGVGILLTGSDYAELRRNQFVGGEGQAIWLGGQRDPILIRSNNISRRSNFAVRADNYFAPLDSVQIDLTGNYWHTTEVDSINAWIYDRNDDPLEYGRVIFQPFLDSPVAATKKSIGELKSQFRSSQGQE